MNNTRTGLRRAGAELWRSHDPTHMIVPKGEFLAYYDELITEELG